MARQQKSKSIKSDFTTVVAPDHCSLIENTELVLQLFNKAENAYSSGSNVRYDMSKVTTVTESFCALLVAHIKDININRGKASTIEFPLDPDCAKKLRRLGIFKKVGDKTDFVDLGHLPIRKLTNLKVANLTAKETVIDATKMLYGTEIRIKELYAILIELMANTNNHATSDDKAAYPWWLFYYFDSHNRLVKFVFLDLGIGLFESLPVRQFIMRNPLNNSMLQSISVKARRILELDNIFGSLVAGRINSSTGDAERGRGIPLIAEAANSGHFNNFKIISNDGYIDLKNRSVSQVDEHFSGTFYYFELKELDTNE